MVSPPAMLCRLLVTIACALALACGPAPGGPPRVPAGGVRVVPADRVKGTCRCDDDDDDTDDDDDAPRRRPIEYVKLRDWQPPPQVVEIEMAVPARGEEPASFTTFPQLTLHQSIGNVGYRRLGRLRPPHAR
jgi:hypothetical protein